MKNPAQDSCRTSRRKANPGWLTLDAHWHGDRQSVRTGLPHDVLAPAWQMLLFGDGSPTQLLQLLTRETIEVDVMEMQHTGAIDDGAPVGIEQISAPRLRRQVWLQSASGERLAHATSWWNATAADRYLSDRAAPIWRSLEARHTELYRELGGAIRGDSARLEEAFGVPGPFWGRYYLFWHQRKPLTLIHEVFSPALDRVLGSSRSHEDLLHKGAK